MAEIQGCLSLTCPKTDPLPQGTLIKATCHGAKRYLCPGHSSQGVGALKWKGGLTWEERSVLLQVTYHVGLSGSMKLELWVRDLTPPRPRLCGLDQPLASVSSSVPRALDL